MKKNMWMVAGVAGLFFAYHPADTHAEVGVRIGGIHVNVGDRPHFVIDTRPTFIYVPELGYSVAVRTPYNFIFVDGSYFINRDGRWYRSSNYRGPWDVVSFDRLPHAVRARRWDEIGRLRDREYRRHDHQYWESRDQHHEHDRSDDRNQLREENRDERHDRNR